MGWVGGWVGWWRALGVIRLWGLRCRPCVSLPLLLPLLLQSPSSAHYTGPGGKDPWGRLLGLHLRSGHPRGAGYGWPWSWDRRQAHGCPISSPVWPAPHVYLLFQAPPHLHTSDTQLQSSLSSPRAIPPHKFIGAAAIGCGITYTGASVFVARGLLHAGALVSHWGRGRGGVRGHLVRCAVVFLAQRTVRKGVGGVCLSTWVFFSPWAGRVRLNLIEHQLCKMGGLASLLCPGVLVQC